jgi:hypothetical protein
MDFRWIAWNRGHIDGHGVHWEEAESVVRQAKPPFPEQVGEDKLLVVGQGRGGRFCKSFTCLMRTTRYSSSMPGPVELQ